LTAEQTTLLQQQQINLLNGPMALMKHVPSSRRFSNHDVCFTLLSPHLLLLLQVNYHRDLAKATTGQEWRADMQPINITQPQGPSFSIEGNLVRRLAGWQLQQLLLLVCEHLLQVFVSSCKLDNTRHMHNLLQTNQLTVCTAVFAAVVCACR
jgi:hypothetical protein